MNDSPAQQAARARARRRKRMQQRQTVIFGSIIAILLGVALFAGAVWAELVPSPINIELKKPEEERPAVANQPCPPADATAVPFEEIGVNILNSTQTSGLGARTAESVREHGVTVESIGNATELYIGNAKILAGIESLAAAYTVADLIPGAAIVVDERTESVIDIVIGSSFSSVNEADERTLEPGDPIPAPEGCIALEDLQVEPSGEGSANGDEPEGEVAEGEED